MSACFKNIPVGLPAAVERLVANSVPFTLGSLIVVPRAAGVYVFSDYRGPLYVGLSEDLRRRYREHRDAETNPILKALLADPVHVLRFAWVLCAGPQQVALERQLIRFFDPPANRLRYRLGTG